MHKIKISNYKELLDFITSDKFQNKAEFTANEPTRNEIIFNIGANESSWNKLGELTGSTCIEYIFFSRDIGVVISIGDGPSPYYDHFDVYKSNLVEEKEWI